MAIPFIKKKVENTVDKLPGVLNHITNVRDKLRGKSESSVDSEAASTRTLESDQTSEKRFEGCCTVTLPSYIDYSGRKMMKPWMIMFVTIELVFVGMVLLEIIRWIYHHLGGVKLALIADASQTVSPKYLLNHHVYLMTVSWVTLMIASIILICNSRCHPCTRVVIDLILKLFSLVCFGFGFVKHMIARRHLFKDSSISADFGIHQMIGLVCATFYLLYILHIIFNSFVSLGFKNPQSMAGARILFASVHFVEWQCVTVNSIYLMAILSGTALYHAMKQEASSSDNSRFLQPYQDPQKEKHQIGTTVIVSIGAFIMEIVVMFRKHQMLYHSGLIPYHKYRDNFKQILEKVGYHEQKKGLAAKKREEARKQTSVSGYTTGSE